MEQKWPLLTILLIATGFVITTGVMALVFVYEDYRTTGGVYVELTGLADQWLMFPTAVVTGVSLCIYIYPHNRAMFLSSVIIAAISTTLNGWVLVRRLGRWVDCVTVITSYCTTEKTPLILLSVASMAAVFHSAFTILVMRCWYMEQSNSIPPRIVDNDAVIKLHAEGNAWNRNMQNYAGVPYNDMPHPEARNSSTPITKSINTGTLP